ncbi:hypothetical protein [Sphingorhabdus contaminans]|uniref:hypothetical protein n=1 Tax=Sphingorhabdus contaminans TaxID=1343899 RepID=UPI003D2B7B5D
MTKTLFTGVLSLLIASCSQQDDRICEAVAKAPNTISECVHREGYLLADAEGSIRDVATAVVEKCRNHIIQQLLSKPENGPSLEVYATAIEDNAVEEAIRRVTEARSGNCKKPE